MRHIIILSLSILLISCATTGNYYTQTTQSWRGGNAKKLVKTWGRPDKIIANNQTGTVYFYNTRSYSNLSSQLARTNSNSPLTGKPSSTVCTVAFTANKQGKIVDIQTQGHGCYGNSSFAKHLSNPQKS